VEISKRLLEVLEKGYNNIIITDNKKHGMYFFTVSSKENNKVWMESVARIAVRKGKTVNADLYRKSRSFFESYGKKRVTL